MHRSATRRLAGGIALAALILLASPSAALASEDAPSMTHQDQPNDTSPIDALTGTPAHSDESNDDMGGMDGMDGMDMDGGTHTHSSASRAGGGLDSWAHRGVLIAFALLNGGVLVAAAGMRRLSPKPRRRRPVERTRSTIPVTPVTRPERRSHS